MWETIRAIPNAFIPLFVAIDIIWVLPMFLSMTEGIGPERQGKVIRQSVMTAFVVSVAFTAVGRGVFALLGITVNDFKVAGGLVLLVLAVMDLTRTDARGPIEMTETSGVVPIGVPLIVGPAVMTTIIVLVDYYGVVPTLLALVLNLAVAWGALHGASRIVRFLGSGGIVAVSKVMSILLASISVMMIRLGLEGILGR